MCLSQLIMSQVQSHILRGYDIFPIGLKYNLKKGENRFEDAADIVLRGSERNLKTLLINTFNE